MRPYRLISGGLSCSFGLQFSLVILSVTSFLVTSLPAADRQESPALTSPADEVRSLNASGTRHFYSMEYAAAEQDFRRAIELQPEDAASVNHLLNTLLFDQLNHTGALNTSLYASDKFLALKKQVSVDSKVAIEIKKLNDRALELCNKRLAVNADDEAALYDRGVTRGIFAT